MQATLRRLEDVGFDALTLAVRADNSLRPERLVIRTDHPIAFSSADHVHPRGTANDDTRHPRFVAACEQRFLSPLRHLDLGCAGGGLVWDFLLAGHHSYGVEGSDFSRVNNRGYWRVVPDQFFTADVTHPFALLDSEGLPATFDVVTAWEVLEHLAEETLEQFFDNVRNAMRPNGLFVASVATFPDEDRASGTVWHVTVRPREWWEHVFARCGLKPTQADFDVLDFVRGSGNPRANDWNFRTNPELGFHAVLSRTRV
jgi:SAM-dependent methyltransferase